MPGMKGIIVARFEKWVGLFPTQTAFKCCQNAISQGIYIPEAITLFGGGACAYMGENGGVEIILDTFGGVETPQVPF